MTPVIATIKPVIDLTVIFSLRKKTDNKKAKAGTNEKIVCATEGSMSATVNNDKQTPKTGPKIVPVIANFNPLFLLLSNGRNDSFDFPLSIVNRISEDEAAIKRIKVA